MIFLRFLLPSDTSLAGCGNVRYLRQGDRKGHPYTSVKTSEGAERTRACASGKGSAWRPRHAFPKHGGDAVRYLMDGMDNMDGMDRATARVILTPL